MANDWHLGPRTHGYTVRESERAVAGVNGWEERSEMRGPHQVRWIERPIPGKEDVGGVTRVYLENFDRESNPVGTIALSYR